MPAGWKPTTEQTSFGREETLWRNQVTQGIFKKKVVEVQTITNYRILRNDKGVMFKDIDDVVVMNQHRVSQSNYMGTSYGRYTRFGTGSTRSKGKTVGDVVFMRQGKPVIRFNQIADPHGVVRLAKSVRRSVVQALKFEEKKNKQLLGEKEKDIVQQVSKRGGGQWSVVVCSQCKNENQNGSKFCNNCGARLQNACSNCGKSNPESSAFCGQCGSRLGQQVVKETKAIESSKPSIVEDNFLECMLPEYEIKIKYPATWQQVNKQDLKPPIVVQFGSRRESRSDTFLETVGISVTPFTTNQIAGLTPEKCADFLCDSFRQRHNDFILLESTSTTIAGLPAQQTVFTAGGKRYLYVFTLRGNRLYSIIYWSLPETYPRFLSIAEQMIASFEFIS